MENKWKERLAGLTQKEKMPKKNQLLILLLIGILLVVIVFPVSGPDTAKTESSDTGQSSVSSSDGENLSAYEKTLEKRVAESLEYVEGVGRTEVMITLKSSSEKIVEKDTQSSSQKTTEEDSEGGSRVTEDRSSGKTSVYEQGDNGTQSPYVSKELTPEIAGVVVIADGGDNPVVIENITEAIQALFGVEAHKIKIMKRTDT